MEVWVSAANPNGKERLKLETGIYHYFQDRFYVKYYRDTLIGRFSFPMAINLWRDIRNCDLAHVQSGIMHPVCFFSLLYAFLLGKPVVVSTRGNLGNWSLQQGSRLKKLWLRRFIGPFQQYAVFHATSRQEKRDIQVIYPNAQIVIVPNGTDLKEYRYAKRQNLNDLLLNCTERSHSFSNSIISLGRLHAVKGYDILIKAMPAILKAYPSTALIIAGPDDGELNKLSSLVDELNLRNHIFFPGPVDGEEKINFLASGDVFALPSHNENFGNVYLEALAAGTPIVASVHTPWKEVERAGCGRWVGNTEEEVSAAILDTLGQDREKMRQKSRKFARQFDWQAIAGQMEQHYKQIIETHREGRRRRQN